MTDAAKAMTPDFARLYRAYQDADAGTRALIRRAPALDQLYEDDTALAFYRLIKPLGYMGRGRDQWGRVVFCLPHVRHAENGTGLGAALAQSRKISDRRIFQVVRAPASQDIMQLRRLLQFCNPVLDWPRAAGSLWYWGDNAKRQLLEDFVLGAPGEEGASEERATATSSSDIND
ncbi:MAG: type I-E CRISPR-associated protein Cse2/CasB [Rhodocyclaceae bacterium]